MNARATVPARSTGAGEEEHLGCSAGHPALPQQGCQHAGDSHRPERQRGSQRCEPEPVLGSRLTTKMLGVE